MMDDKNDFIDFPLEAEFGSPPPARFDENASANAQPVQRLPRNPTARWIQGGIHGAIQHARSARQLFAGRSRSLALALIAGLAVGALGGTLAVKEPSPATDLPPVREESATEMTSAQDATSDAAQNEAGNPIIVGAMGLPAAEKPASNARNRRRRAPVQRGGRAYRVAVIR